MDILIIDDDETLRSSTQMAAEAAGHYAETAFDAESARLSLKEATFDLIFLDVRLGEDNGIELLGEILKKKPDQLVVIFTAYSSIEVAVKATQAGAFDFLEKPFGPDRVRGILLKAQKALSTQKEISTLTTEVRELKSQVDTQGPPSDFTSEDESMEQVLDTLFRAAKTPASILILGESGTGKSLIARTVHQNSLLHEKPFITVSCPSLSHDLLESELFGHVKGAFTGAVKDSQGKVAAANGGTLFLDEIGELPMEIQPKLLRLFREDLFYRLNVISVEIPSLRSRGADLVKFATNYLNYFCEQIDRQIKGFSPEALQMIRTYPWPGNLRELRNTIERATILQESSLPEHRSQSMN